MATCVTGTAQVSLKTWPAEKWAAVLSDWAARRGRRFLMVGLPSERPVAEEVRRLMGDRADHAAVWMEEGSGIEQLVALTSLASGYVGHDTGPMHVAAALGKPVLGVFGGGTWPRFTPRVTPSVAVTVGVPCAGCDWSCSFDTSHCIKDVPVEEVARAVDDLEEGRVTGREARVLEPSLALRDRMISEVSRFAQLQVREAGKWLKELEYAKSNGLADALRERDAISLEAKGMAEQLIASAAEADKLRLEARRIAGEADWLRLERGASPTRPPARCGSWRSASGRSSNCARRRRGRKRKRSSSNRNTPTLQARAEETEPLREQVRRLEERLRAMEAAGTAVMRAPPAVAPGVDGAVHRKPRLRPLVVARGSRRSRTSRSRRSSARTPTPTRGPGDDRIGRLAGLPAARLRRDRRLAGRRDVAPSSSRCGRGSNRRAASSASRMRPRGCGGAFDTSEADVIGWIDAGDVHEPGALLRVAEAFRDNPRHPRSTSTTRASRDGWRFPPTPRPKLEVYRLLATVRHRRAGAGDGVLPPARVRVAGEAVGAAGGPRPVGPGGARSPAGTDWAAATGTSPAGGRTSGEDRVDEAAREELSHRAARSSSPRSAWRAGCAAR